MNVGDQLYCHTPIYNNFDQVLCAAGTWYTIQSLHWYATQHTVVLNHILYGSEYGEFDVDILPEYFITRAQIRARKLNRILW